ncbi:O-antigen ligase family protein [Tabrizicola sp.]|uniref:O-antigen ligase family protein n=1 Tax=Tabrizicola sp. TaxID=2005166 RepID=UPI003F2CCF71
MTAGAVPTRQGMVVLRLCPNAALGFVALLSLQFVPMFGTMAALLFLMSALALIARRPKAVSAELLGQIGLCLLVGWCILSVLWSDYPALSLRHSLQLAVTVLFAIVLAHRLSPIVLLKILAVCFLIACAVSLASGRARADGMGFLGIYNSKNAMAAASSLLLLIGLCLIVDRRLSGRWRWLGVAGSALGLVLLIKANSVGAAVATAAVCAALPTIAILRRLSGTQRLVAGVLAGLAFTGILLALLANIDQIAGAFLQATGKDFSLTGRTDLWQVAFDEIAGRPFLGAGYQAVWVPGNPIAEELWEEFGVENRSGFHFHNAYLSNAVEIGVIGAALQAILVLGGLIGTLAWVMRDFRAETLFLALFMVRQVALSIIEVPFFFQFDAATILTVAALVYVRRAAAERRVQGLSRPAVRGRAPA